MNEKRKMLMLFIGKTVLFYLIFILLIYIFDYLGHGQSAFIYNEF
ncbi:D-alanyl-lipoteichoic acid biosynthesis protein [Streptococcus penaeicida]|uniref:D-alanyl-lipoteichoic acid biosynthesis protein n=1 Tax=Streptococcus penaeicida TaxID=1765960 RepID=A0A2N8LCG6_9STRE|nr:teichoic acid D-Ala incorporation-associated protein DltX [Streptococcus penaeicida]PND47842.1 D-alanyl-lipoteichoic acid biosynthesis protein [Streptococcus penaeicida]